MSLTVSIEDKIELFSNILFKDIEETFVEKKQKAAEDFEKEKNRLLTEIENKKKRIIEESAKKAEKERQQIFAKAKASIHHRLLEKKQELMEDIYELLINEAEKYVSTEGYKEYLSKNLDRAAAVFENSPSVMLYFSKRDIEMLGSFINQSIESGALKGRYHLKETDKNILGGFYAEDSKGEMQADYTFRTLIEESRELIGISVSRRFDEVHVNG